MYLKGQTPQQHNSFFGWKDLIMEDLQCDNRACAAFVKLSNTAPDAAPHGFMECSRILAHIFKGQAKPEDLNPYRHQDMTNWYAFMCRACEEASEALEDPADFKTLRNKFGGRGFRGFGENPAGHPGPASGSSSTGGGKGPAGKGTAPAGMYYTQGLR